MQKLLIIIILAICTSINAFSQTIPNWITIPGNKDEDFFYDPNGISGEPSNRTIFIKGNFKIAAKDGSFSRLMKYSVSCNDGTILMEQVKTYPIANLQGQEKEIKLAEGRVRYKPNSDSVGAIIFSMACNDSNINQASNINNVAKSDIDNEFKIARDFLDRKVDWIFVIKNKDNFPVYISSQEIFLTQSKEIIANVLINYDTHVEGGISSIDTLKISNCFYSDSISFKFIRDRYFSEINGKGLVIWDKVPRDETYKIDLDNLYKLVWHRVAQAACNKAKQINESNLQKYEIVKKQLSVLETQAGMNLYKQYQVEDEKKTQKIRLAMEDKSKRERDEKQQAKNKALEGKLLFTGLVNTLNTGTLIGSCAGVFSHLVIHTNHLYARSISKPAKNQDDEFRNKKEADQYLRAGELGGILSKKINNSFTDNVLPSEQADYFQSMNNSMYMMQNLNDSDIAYEAYKYCRQKIQ